MEEGGLLCGCGVGGWAGTIFSVVWRGGGLGWSVWAERRWRGELSPMGSGVWAVRQLKSKLSPMESDEEIMKFVKLGETDK